MTTNRPGIAVGVFEEGADACAAVRELKVCGFSDAHIGVAARYDETGRESDSETASEAGAVTGLAAGAGIGTLWGLAILAGVLPGIGTAIAGGTLGVLLSSAAAGAAVAGVAGALIGLGIPEEDAAYYEDEFKAGRTIVTVKAGSRADEAASVMAQFNALAR